MIDYAFSVSDILYDIVGLAEVPLTAGARSAMKRCGWSVPPGSEEGSSPGARTGTTGRPPGSMEGRGLFYEAFSRVLIVRPTGGSRDRSRAKQGLECVTRPCWGTPGATKGCWTPAFSIQSRFPGLFASYCLVGHAYGNCDWRETVEGANFGRKLHFHAVGRATPVSQAEKCGVCGRGVCVRFRGDELPRFERGRSARTRRLEVGFWGEMGGRTVWMSRRWRPSGGGWSWRGREGEDEVES